MELWRRKNSNKKIDRRSRSHVLKIPIVLRKTFELKKPYHLKSPGIKISIYITVSIWLGIKFRQHNGQTKYRSQTFF